MKLKDALKLDFVFISDGTISVNSIYLFLRIKMNVLTVLDNKILWNCHSYIPLKYIHLG